MKLIFMGTPDFAVAALDALLAAGHEVVCVYTQPPRPAGRGKAERPTPVHARADALGLEVRHPVSLKSEAEVAAFAALDAEVAVVAAYGLILPVPILEAPPMGCLNIHASLLPRWRGAAPIQRAIMAGDAQTGICIMDMAAGLDTGAVRHEVQTPIAADDTAQTLHDRLAELGGRAIVEVLRDPAGYPPVDQPEAGITYAAKIDKAEARINWSDPAVQIDRQIRGLSPFPGAWCEIDGERVKLLQCQLEEAKGAPGTVLDDRFLVACGSGAVRILRAQRAGRGVAGIDDFLRGFDLPQGKRLS